MNRDDAYEMASQQGFEGNVFHTEEDAGVGHVKHVRIALEDEETGETSTWHAEVSEANGCECFSAWDSETESFYRESIAARKASRKSKGRKASR